MSVSFCHAPPAGACNENVSLSVILLIEMTVFAAVDIFFKFIHILHRFECVFLYWRLPVLSKYANDDANSSIVRKHCGNNTRVLVANMAKHTAKVNN